MDTLMNEKIENKKEMARQTDKGGDKTYISQKTYSTSFTSF